MEIASKFETSKILPSPNPSAGISKYGSAFAVLGGETQRRSRRLNPDLSCSADGISLSSYSSHRKRRRLSFYSKGRDESESTEATRSKRSPLGGEKICAIDLNLPPSGHSSEDEECYGSVDGDESRKGFVDESKETEVFAIDLNVSVFEDCSNNEGEEFMKGIIVHEGEEKERLGIDLNLSPVEHSLEDE